MLFALALGKIMAAASHQLRIKYGLGHEPDTSERARWAGLVRQLISEGIERESAGERAAMQLFTDFRIRHFASQADTIDTLLRLADQK
jgi:hypothetical protein